MDYIFLFFTLLFSSTVIAHSGGLDSNGGHTDKKIGTYHCHKANCKPNQSNTELVGVRSDKYNRDDWPHWSDFDGDCMNTRHEMLLLQVDGDIKLSPDGCYVNTGTWNDPFSGKIIHRASDLDVDHIIPLKWAHDHGGSTWSTDKKELFANDPLNLLVVDDGLNQSKGAKGPSEWMPPNHQFRCDYLLQWQNILNKFPTLKMTHAENRIFIKQKEACGLK